MIPISVVVLAKNSALTIARTLESLREFSEVIVYDNGSSDETIDIAKSFSNVVLVEGEFRGFGWSKNRAASYAKNEWILVIDSDEVPDSTLIETLRTTTLDEACVYKLNFKAFYKDTQIKHCGWNNQKIKRLYNKTKTGFNDNDVHENIISEGFCEEVLDGSVGHYSYHSISDFIIKSDRYSSLFAQNNKHKRASSPSKAFFNALYSFFRTYIIKQGFRDGYIGLVIAFSHMASNFYKYIKLYELNLEKK